MSGNDLKRRREKLGLSVYELAYVFEVAPSSIYRWEAGATKLDGLVAIGADTVLKTLERPRRSQPAADEEDGS